MLISMIKDGDAIYCEESQVAAFGSRGYQRADAAEKSSPIAQVSLKDTLLGLDPDADDDWTADKLVKLSVLKELTGREVSRAEVNEAWSGFNRDVLRDVLRSGSSQ